MANTSTNYVDFGPRFLAYLVDGIVVSVISMILSSLFMVRTINYNMSFGPSLLVGIAYYVYFWSQRDGQTLGAKLLKFKVVREDGKPIDVTTAVIRYIGLIVSSIPFGLGLFWVLWDKKKQGWHDKMAGTVVVKE